MVSNWLIEYAIATKKSYISYKKIEIVWVSAAHTASYNFISLTPLFIYKIKWL